MLTSNSKLVRRTLALTSLLAPLVFILYYCEVFLRNNGEGDEPRSYKARYAEVFNHTVNAPVLILGSSVSAHGIVPSKLNLGKAVFNFSFNGGTCEFNLSFYRDYLKKYYNKPKYIIYVLSPNSFARFWRKIEDDTKYLPTNDDGIMYNLLHYKDLKVLNTGTIAEEFVKTYARDHSSTGHVGMDMRKYDNGFVPYNSGKKYEVVKGPPLPFDPAEISAASALMAELKSDGIKVILVTLPAPSGRYLDSDIDQFNKIVDDLGGTNQIPVVKTETIAPGFGKDLAMFNDEAHFTEKAALIFSEKLSVALHEFIK